MRHGDRLVSDYPLSLGSTLTGMGGVPASSRGSEIVRGTPLKARSGMTLTHDPGDYDALVLPGGVANPDQLRTDRRAIEFVQQIFSAGKPVGVICHGPWTLVEADLVRGGPP